MTSKTLIRPGASITSSPGLSNLACLALMFWCPGCTNNVLFETRETFHCWTVKWRHKTRLNSSLLNQITSCPAVQVLGRALSGCCPHWKESWTRKTRICLTWHQRALVSTVYYFEILSEAMLVWRDNIQLDYTSFAVTCSSGIWGTTRFIIPGFVESGTRQVWLNRTTAQWWRGYFYRFYYKNLSTDSPCSRWIQSTNEGCLWALPSHLCIRWVN